MFNSVVAAIVSAQAPPAQVPEAQSAGPIIDIHSHAPRVGRDDRSVRSKMLQSMDKHGIAVTVIYMNEPSDVTDWRETASKRFIRSVAMPCWRNRDLSYYCFPKTAGWPNLQWLERQLAAGRVNGLGEMLFNYSGVGPDDIRMRPYWALAAKYDVPVFVHTGLGPGPGQGPREDPNCCVNYDPRLGNPALLRAILEKYPKLRMEPALEPVDGVS